MLGYLVSKGHIQPDPDRLKPLRDLNEPHNAKSKQRVIGMFAYYYYSSWIPKFSDKVQPLVKNNIFPLPQEVKESFELLKKEIEMAAVTTIDHESPLVVETDASDIAIAATLNQNGRPVAFFSRTLNQSERKHSSVEKEAYAIVEALRKWRHYLIGRHFQLVTDQKSVAFM
ncbi:retrovirus-related pol polyprotein from transposon 17.6 [Plakobranchus ocellatus]|uniref:Retrovirus-related pol polyprotein from transposon 17.6 n=1 Tax=Plakobranchus ocellatus TaxID=259542 RepID=A0AAV4AY34_9GAST|nr:retrovirus-related pol polyprotein from transposon 17.6 [Plakobranchus ocellatus]